MNKNSIATLLKNLGGKISQNSPTILTFVSLGGLLGTVIFAIRDTRDALYLSEDEEIERKDRLTKIEVFKLVWKCYIPTVTMSIATGICIVGSHSIQSRRIEALAAVYGLTERAYSQYREKVIETIGEKKEKVVQETVARDVLRDNPIGNREVIFTGNGTTKCYDVLSKRYFWSDMDRIKKVENQLNHQLISENYVSLNEFYAELNLDSIPLGRDLGWSVSDGYISLHFGSHIDDAGTPCLVISYPVAPRYDYLTR